MYDLVRTSATVEKRSEDIDLENERWENVLPGSYDPFARIMDMDRDGVEAEVHCGCLRKMVPLVLGGA